MKLKLAKNNHLNDRSLRYGLHSSSPLLRGMFLLLAMTILVFTVGLRFFDIQTLSLLERYQQALDESQYEIILFGNSNTLGETNTYYDGQQAFYNLSIDPLIVQADLLIETETAQYSGNYFNLAWMDGEWQPYPKLETNQVVVSRNAATIYNLDLGDQIILAPFNNLQNKIIYEVAYITMPHYGFGQVSVQVSKGLFVFGFNEALANEFPPFFLPVYGNIAFRNFNNRADFAYSQEKLNILKQDLPEELIDDGIQMIQSRSQTAMIQEQIDNFLSQNLEFYFNLTIFGLLLVHLIEKHDYLHLRINYRYRWLEMIVFKLMRSIQPMAEFGLFLFILFGLSFFLPSNGFIGILFYRMVLQIIGLLIISALLFSLIRSQSLEQIYHWVNKRRQHEPNSKYQD